jgi:hypothetical protein
MQHLYETESDRTSIDSFPISKSKVSELKQMFNTKNTTKSENASTKEDYTCECCDNKSSGSFIILSCNHMFHIKCLTEMNLKDIYKYPVLDIEYFESRKCSVCDENIQTEDMLYLHSKFLSSTKKLISNHDNSIEHLEHQLRQIKSELRTCYEYKHKLEQEREKSKQIVSVLSTMM